MRTRANTNAPTKRRIQATIIGAYGTDCAACGRTTIVGGGPRDGYTFNLGHVVSEANGGEFIVSNLLPICRRCNVSMGERNWPDVAPMSTMPSDLPLVADPGTGEHDMEPIEWV